MVCELQCLQHELRLQVQQKYKAHWWFASSTLSQASLLHDVRAQLEFKDIEGDLQNCILNEIWA